jgi:hypothetical protein
MLLLLSQDPSGLMSNSTFQGALGAAKALVTTAKPTCLGIAFGMLAISVFWMITQAIVFQRGWDVLGPLKIVGFIFFMSFYNELATSILWTADTVSNLFEAKQHVLQALGKISGGELEKSTTTVPLMGSIPSDNDFTSILIWIMSKIQEGLSLVIRILVSKMQIMVVSFLYVAGLFSATLATVPGLAGSFAYWLKNLITVLFWSLTLAILDNFMVFFLKLYQPDAMNAMIDLVVLNLAIIIMYISIPLLTTMYIGHSSAGGLLSNLSGKMGGIGSAGAGYVAGQFSKGKDGSASPISRRMASIGNMINGTKNSAKRG